ncbi:MAG: thiamine phosphate synthase [Rickettsiales bacterium]|nr:thiamine phosphate synthase [Rickettsiales bacterium]
MAIKNILISNKPILYLVTERLHGDMSYFKSVITDAAKAGVDLIQLREKNISVSEHRKIAKEVKEITDKYNIPLIINDNPIVASEINAAGVHIGQDDIDIDTTRKIVGNKAIIGISIENIEQAKILPQDKVEYIAISPLFMTKTKKDAAPPVGLEEAKKIRKIITKPLFAIGGINSKNAQDVILSGIDGICVVSAIFNSPNPFLATQQLRQLINEAAAI